MKNRNYNYKLMNTIINISDKCGLILEADIHGYLPM